MLLAPLALSIALSGHDALRRDVRDPSRLVVRPAPVYYIRKWELMRARDAVREGVAPPEGEPEADEVAP